MNGTNATKNNALAKTVLKGLGLLGGLLALLLTARGLGLEDMLRDKDWFAGLVGHLGTVQGALLFLALAAAATGLGVPRQLVALLGGSVFGATLGTLYSTVGCALSCLAVAGYARLFGRSLVAGRFGPRIAKLDAFLGQAPLRMALAIRLFPVGHNLTTNLCAGVTGIPLGAFTLGSTLGYVPQNLVFALFGAGVSAESDAGVMLSVGCSVALFAASTWLGISLYRKHRARASGAVGEYG